MRIGAQICALLAEMRSSADGWFALALLSTTWNLRQTFHCTSYFHLGAALGGACLGVAALVQLRDRRALMPLSTLLIPSLWCMDVTNAKLVALLPHTYDALMLRIDHGVSISIYHWAEAHYQLVKPFRMIYDGLPLFTGCVLSLTPRRGRCAWAMGAAGLLGVCFYVAFPATGPAYIGNPYAARNCMPSLHLTWALLLMFYTEPPWRWLCALFALGTAIATLTTGEHYLLDLLVAVPYSLLMFVVANGAGALFSVISAPPWFRYRAAPDSA